MSEHDPMARAAILAARRGTSDHASYERGWQAGWMAAVEWCADVSWSAGVDEGFSQGVDAARAERRMEEDQIWADGYAEGLKDNAEVVAKLKQQLAERDE